MRTVVQRVTSASVRWDGGEASIGRGYCVLLGVADTDQDRDADYLADKLLKLGGSLLGAMLREHPLLRPLADSRSLLERHLVQIAN